MGVAHGMVPRPAVKKGHHGAPQGVDSPAQEPPWSQPGKGTDASSVLSSHTMHSHATHSRHARYIHDNMHMTHDSTHAPHSQTPLNQTLHNHAPHDNAPHMHTRCKTDKTQVRPGAARAKTSVAQNPTASPNPSLNPNPN